MSYTKSETETTDEKKPLPKDGHTTHNYKILSQRPGVITAKCKSCGKVTALGYETPEDAANIKIGLRLSNLRHGLAC